MVDIKKYNIKRVVIKDVGNDWGEPRFSKAEVIRCVYDMGSSWLAINENSNIDTATPHVISKDDCERI